MFYLTSSKPAVLCVTQDNLLPFMGRGDIVRTEPDALREMSL